MAHRNIMSNHPSFLVGAERSGTTMLRLMLDHHPEIAWLQEFEYAVDRVADDGQWPDLEDYLGWLTTHRIFQAREFSVDQSLSYPELVRSFLEQHRQRAGKPLIGATCHRNFHRLLYLWPEARFIHLVRDGRAVARSVINMGWSSNMWTASRKWVEAERTWDHLCETLAESRYIEVKYEELLADPEKELDRICCFLGVSYDSAMLRYPEDTTYGAPDSSLTDQWLHRLDTSEIELAERRIGGLLEKRGYQAIYTRGGTVSSLQALRFKLKDKLFGWRKGLRKYGPALWLSEKLLRWLRLYAAWRPIRFRMNRIDESFLK